MKILLVEDDVNIMETVVDYLELKGFIVDCAYNGKAALQLTQDNTYDIIVMDIMMPKLDGIETVQRLRQEQYIATPILFLTARDSIEDKSLAFTAGGDDYLVKPFALEELVLRLQALIRRGGLPHVAELRVDQLCYHIQEENVSYAGEKIKLSKLQKHILKILFKKYPGIVSRADLTHEIWGENAPDSDALRSHIYSLRKALQKQTGKQFVATVPKQGFCLDSE